jgi:hypothetical protein
LEFRRETTITAGRGRQAVVSVTAVAILTASRLVAGYGVAILFGRVVSDCVRGQWSPEPLDDARMVRDQVLSAAHLPSFPIVRGGLTAVGADSGEFAMTDDHNAGVLL